MTAIKLPGEAPGLIPGIISGDLSPVRREDTRLSSGGKQPNYSCLTKFSHEPHREAKLLLSRRIVPSTYQNSKPTADAYITAKGRFQLYSNYEVPRHNKRDSPRKHAFTTYGRFSRRRYMTLIITALSAKSKPLLRSESLVCCRGQVSISEREAISQYARV